MRRMRGVVQHYAWGDRDAIPRLTSSPPDGRPWAEMWFGTHPAAPATTEDGEPLAAITGDLPYLVKILAAVSPLSLQTHPGPDAATAGFARETAAAIAIDHPQRIYRDPWPKPELLCALTEFEALCGLRDPGETHRWFVDEGWNDLAALIADGDLDAYLRATLGRDDIALPSTLPRWAAELRAHYPDEPGSVAAALALNHVVLRPGEALLLDAGNLHAYLRGVGVEVMSASDNVVRAGFTTKHVDVDEVLRVADLRPMADPIVRPRQTATGVWTYPTVTDDFELSRCEVDGLLRLDVPTGPELLLCTSGAIEGLASGEAAIVEPGEVVELRGSATVWRCRAASNARTAPRS